MFSITPSSYAVLFRITASLFIFLSVLHSFEVWAKKLVGPDKLLLTTHNLAPYQNIDMTGFMVNRIKCTLGEMRQPYQITMTTWPKAQVLVRSGLHHGFFASPPSKEHDSYATLSKPLGTQNLRWYFRPGVNTKPDELSKLRLNFSALFGSSAWFWLKRNKYNIVKRPQDTQTLFSMLKTKEIDVALEDELVFNIEATTTLPRERFHSKVFKTNPLGVYFSNQFLKKHPGFLIAFNAALSKCKNNKLAPI